MKIQMKPIAAAMALTLAAGPVWAVQNFYLAAKAFDKNLPDGTVVTMWGYAEDAGGTCYNTTPTAARQACVDGLTASLPGPQLTLIDPADPDIRIFLTNNLPEPTSIIIPGQKMPQSNLAGGSTNYGPTWDDGSDGSRPSSTARVRSFGKETAPNGGRNAYRWVTNQNTPLDTTGTLMYHSGTWPQKQVYMGLAGLVTRDSVAGEIYPGVAYSSEATLFYSDIDPAFNAEVVATANTKNLTAADRHPTWFLVNGDPYDPGVTPDIAAGAAGSNTLLRLASTAMDTHVSVLQGLRMTLHAEDGQQYNYQVSGVSTPAPRLQYSAMLPPAKTKDAIVMAPAEGTYAVYDGNGYMTNPSDPANEAVGDSVGGMIRFLAFGASGPVNSVPVVTAPTPDPLSVTAPLCAVSMPASDAAIAAWLGSASATDAEDGPLTPTNNAPVDFALGNTLVTFSATDSGAAIGTATATVQIVETPNDAPSVTAPDPLSLNVPSGTSTVPASNVDIAAWLASVTASDPQDGTLVPSNDAPADFPTALTPGETTTVTFSATDSCGQTTNATSTVTIVEEGATPTASLYFSTVGNTNPPGVAGTPDDADVYSWDGTAFSRVLDITTLGVTGSANIDGLVVVDPTHMYMTFNASNTTIPGIGAVQDEDIVYYDNGVFSLYFDGTAAGLGTSSNLDIDGMDIVGGNLYFSTVGNTNPPGVAGTADDADIYSWDGSAYSRVFDATAAGLAGGANVDALKYVDATHFYLSFAGTTTIPGVGNVQDEDIVYYNNGTWSVHFDATAAGLGTSGNLDIDAIQVLP